MFQLRSRRLLPALLFAGLSSSLYAVDGVVLIDQNHAMAGNVTPGDAPGFPVTISQPGSYRLSGNLTVADTNTTAIMITANYVNLDLNGFTISGPLVCVGAPVTCTGPGQVAGPLGSGVFVRGNDSSVVNGFIHGMGGTGLVFAGAGLGAYVEKVHSNSNGGNGIEVTTGIVTGSTANDNQFSGIVVGFFGTVSGNTAAFNGTVNFLLNCPTAMIANSAFANPPAVNVSTNGTGCTFTGNAP
jgi:hypothetical protein